MRLISSVLTLSLLFTSAELLSQELGLEEVKENVSIFSGIVEEALALDQATGIFGNRVGGVDSLYLSGQGVVLEIRTPLANKRKQMGFASLGRAMRSISRSNPFAALNAQSNSVTFQTETSPASADENSAERMATVDYSLIVNSAIQQASTAARSLRTTGDVDDSAYAVLQQELDSLREQTQDKMAEFRELIASSSVEPATTGSVPAADSVQLSSSKAPNENKPVLKEEFDAFLASVEPLKQQALAKAAELQARSEQAHVEYTAQLSVDILSFQAKLFETLCTYGATLSALPADENLSVILKDLGAETDRSTLSDKVHVVAKRELQKCQSGEIDSAQLLAGSSSYDY
ncbi:MAG: hypothetical protein AB8B95_12405 [Pseudohongiellaceae bacterium]